MTLAPGGMAETVQVVAESPLIDVKQSARATNLREEAIEKMPKGRDFTSLVTQAPGVNPETQARRHLDRRRVRRREPLHHRRRRDAPTSGTASPARRSITDFVDEVQVKSSGYTAEYGGATGGVINAVTKSGTNTFRGDAMTYYSVRRPRLRTTRPTPPPQARPNSQRGRVHHLPQGRVTRWEPGFNLGGPIVKDKMWFFAGYQPSFDTTDRTVDPQPTASPALQTQDITRQYITANITGQPSAADPGPRVAYNNCAASSARAACRTLDGTTSPPRTSP